MDAECNGQYRCSGSYIANIRGKKIEKQRRESCEGLGGFFVLAYLYFANHFLPKYESFAEGEFVEKSQHNFPSKKSTMYLPNYRTLVQFSNEKMAKVNLFESHRMFADFYCLRPGQSQKTHSHADNDKIYFLLEGECVCILGEQERVLLPGESCVAPAGVPHGVRNDSEGEIVLLVMMAPRP